MPRAPSLFVSHGSPMFALEPGVLGPTLQQVGAGLPDLAAIVVASPHWQTRGVRVTGAAGTGAWGAAWGAAAQSIAASNSRWRIVIPGSRLMYRRYRLCRAATTG